jgi:uncharacterized protein
LTICLVYYLVQEKMIFVPTVYGSSFRYKLASEFEELSIPTPKGGEINGILIRQDHARGVIFYLHGNTGSLNRWSYSAEELKHFGFHVFAMDYRGYGKSSGHRSEALMHSDVLACWENIQSRFPGMPMHIYGRSLGSGFAVRLAARIEAKSLLLETPFYSLTNLARMHFPFLPVKFLLKYEFRSDKYLSRVKCPIAIFHGTKDRIVPYRSALKLYKLIADRPDTLMVTVVGAKHNNLNAYPLFREKVAAFLDGHVVS